jgi:hypothetical protein
MKKNPESMKEYDSVKDGDTIQTDWWLPLLKCIRDPEKTTDKKIKRQVLKYKSIDDELYQRTEAVPLRNMTHREVISFEQEHIIYQFGIPQTLTTNHEPSFMSHQFIEFAESMKIKLLNSSPYYAQANGQAEASNKVLIKIIKKRIKDNLRRWHEKLSEALWAHRTSRHRVTKVTPFELVNGQEAVLPMEIGLHSLRVTG